MLYINKAASVFDLIEAIAATGSKKEKEALVAQGMGLPLFAKIVTRAYSPFTRHYMRAVPKRREDIAPGANTLDESWPWEVLEKLSSRELSGDAAYAEVQKLVDFLEPKSGELLRRIILGDMRAGFTEGTINRVAPGTIPEFPYMRCSLPPKSNMDKFDWARGVFSQEKADGEFANVNLTSDRVLRVTTRQGTEYPDGALGALELALGMHLAPGTQTHGEFVVFEDDKLMPRELGNGILNSLQQGGTLAPNQAVHFLAWDQIPLAAVKPKGQYSVPYEHRFVELAKQVKVANAAGCTAFKMIPTKLVRSKEDALAHAAEIMARGGEGTIVKARETIWKDGTSKDQVKIKLAVDVDLEIIAIAPGKRDTKNEGRPGAFSCATSCGKLLVDVTIKNEALRDAVEADNNAFIGKIIPVRANAIMKPSESNDNYSLFLPRMASDKVRTDKSVADDLERVQAIFDAAAGIKRTVEAVPA